MTAEDRLREWRQHRARMEERMKTLPDEICAAARAQNTAAIWRLAENLADACQEFARTTGPIAEWEQIVADENTLARTPPAPPPHEGREM